jgi:Transglycosylase SLT domain
MAKGWGHPKGRGRCCPLDPALLLLPWLLIPTAGCAAAKAPTWAGGAEPAPIADATRSRGATSIHVPARTGVVRLPVDPAQPAAPDGLRYPLVPRDPVTLATLLSAVEEALRSPLTPATSLPALGHQQQVIYRVLAYLPPLASQVRSHLQARWWPAFDHQLAARRAFIAMQAGRGRPRQVPAWRIIAPEPAANLLRYYREAAAASGIPWPVLAAVNLVESGMGRIDGVSVADARGPMQFLPSTWAEPGIGQGGDIRDPRSAIQAAARYLVRRGGLRDIRRALWGYNNSAAYGEAVLQYAALLQEDPAAFTGLYHWQIHYAAAGGDLWLPVGYQQNRPVPVADYLRRFPFSQAPPGSSGY